MDDEMIHSTCIDRGCSDRASVAGWCVGHAIARYRMRVKATKPPVARPEGVRDCSFDGCPRVAPVHSLCASHRRQLDRDGRLTPIEPLPGRRYL